MIKTFLLQPIEEYIGKKIVYGIRPEDLHRDTKWANSEGTNKINIVAELAEMMGSEIYVYSNIGEVKIIAKVPSSEKIKTGMETELYIDIEKPHVFDPDTEELICD